MIRQMMWAGLFALTAGTGAAQAVSVDGAESYDLLFRNGTLDALETGETLHYGRAVTNALVPEADARDTGQIDLHVSGGEPRSAELTFHQGEGHRALATFPASVGNPMIMYFYETVVRDMAEAAGGSPYYIRNRVKDALTKPAEKTEGQAVVDGQTVPTMVIQLRPFAGDPNRDRMQGFGDLVLRVTMSDAVPGWYVSLVAEAPGQDGPIYRSALTYEGMEP